MAAADGGHDIRLKEEDVAAAAEPQAVSQIDRDGGVMARKTTGVLVTAFVLLVSAAAMWFVSQDRPLRRDLIVAIGSDDESVRRVIGLSGDTVEIRDGEVLVNGEVLSEDAR